VSTHNDIELLGYAAKAIGFNLWKNKADAYQLYDGPHNEGEGKFVCFWNPLADDGDALRLMIRLEIKLTNDIIRLIENEKVQEIKK